MQTTDQAQGHPRWPRQRQQPTNRRPPDARPRPRAGRRMPRAGDDGPCWPVGLRLPCLRGSGPCRDPGGRQYPGARTVPTCCCSFFALITGGRYRPAPTEHDPQPHHMQNRPSALASVHCGRFVFHGPSLRRTHYLERAQRSGVYGPTVSRYRQSAGCSADHQSRGRRRHRSRQGWQPGWCCLCRGRVRARR